MLFYIDYLDHITSGSKSFSLLTSRLKYDLLIFGCDTLCMSVPACVKLNNTTELLMQLDEFWRAGKIVLQLDKKHCWKPTNYFSNRKNVLANSIPEENLLTHFEFVAYESERPNKFFNIYLPEVVGKSNRKLYIGKKKDTDELFRKEAIHLFDTHFDSICQSLEVNRGIIFAGATNKIQSYALDSSILFQRAVIEEDINNSFELKNEEQTAIATILDRAFAMANAGTSDAIPISLVANQLTGKWMMHLLSKTYKRLYDLICSLNWNEVYILSKNEEWRNFVKYINAYISVIQNSAKQKYNVPIETFINRLSKSIEILSMAKIVKNEATSAVKSKLFKYGIFSEAQNAEIMAELIADAYVGKFRKIIDTLLAIDNLANILIIKLESEKRYSHLINVEHERIYDVLK